MVKEIMKMSEPKYYSQYQEDKYLSRILKKEKGLCIEIGGFDGVTGSTTYYFEKIGWDCVIVEPIPSLYNKIVANRKCVVLNLAVSDKNGETSFSIAEGVEMLSSLHPDKKRIELEKGKISEIKVKTKTLDSILGELKIDMIDFISIDVEGHEMSVLNGFSVQKYDPKIMILENNDFGMNSEIKNYLEPLGFIRFKITGCNEWYTNRANKHLYSSGDIFSANLLEFQAKVQTITRRFLKRVIPKSLLEILKNKR